LLIHFLEIQDMVQILRVSRFGVLLYFEGYEAFHSVPKPQAALRYDKLRIALN